MRTSAGNIAWGTAKYGASVLTPASGEVDTRCPRKGATGIAGGRPLPPLSSSERLLQGDEAYPKAAN